MFQLQSRIENTLNSLPNYLLLLLLFVKKGRGGKERLFKAHLTYRWLLAGPEKQAEHSSQTHSKGEPGKHHQM